MCGRYLFNDENSEAMKAIIATAKGKYKADALNDVSWNEVYPSAQSVVMVYEDKLTPVLMKWGYPKWDSKNIIINARSEKIKTSRFFSEDYQTRRCVVACRGFYEWNQDKKRFFIRDPHTDVIYLAAIWRIVDNQPYYCILTKPAANGLEKIHDRMPVVMNEKAAITYCQAAKSQK